MNYLAGGIFIVMIGLFIFERIRHDKAMARKDEMLAANSYQEFKYYQGLYKDELKELKVLRGEARKERGDTYEEVDITEGKPLTMEEAKMAAFDEDYDDDEIDMKELKKHMETK